MANENYAFRVNADADEEQVEVEVEDKQDHDAGKSGNIDLYYAGSETPTDLPELIGSKHVYHFEGVEGGEGASTNIADEATLTYDVPRRYIEGNGEFIVYFGASPDPVARISAEDARHEETEGKGDIPASEPPTKSQVKAAGKEHETRERKTRARDYGAGKLAKQGDDEKEDLDAVDAIEYVASIFGVDLPDPEDYR